MRLERIYIWNWWPPHIINYKSWRRQIRVSDCSTITTLISLNQILWGPFTPTINHLLMLRHHGWDPTVPHLSLVLQACPNSLLSYRWKANFVHLKGVFTTERGLIKDYVWAVISTKRSFQEVFTTESVQLEVSRWVEWHGLKKLSYIILFIFALSMH